MEHFGKSEPTGDKFDNLIKEIRLKEQMAITEAESKARYRIMNVNRTLIVRSQKKYKEVLDGVERRLKEKIESIRAEATRKIHEVELDRKDSLFDADAAANRMGDIGVKDILGSYSGSDETRLDALYEQKFAESKQNSHFNKK